MNTNSNTKYEFKIKSLASMFNFQCYMCQRLFFLVWCSSGILCLFLAILNFNPMQLATCAKGFHIFVLRSCLLFTGEKLQNVRCGLLFTRGYSTCTQWRKVTKCEVWSSVFRGHHALSSNANNTSADGKTKIESFYNFHHIS